MNSLNPPQVLCCRPSHLPVGRRTASSRSSGSCRRRRQACVRRSPTRSSSLGRLQPAAGTAAGTDHSRSCSRWRPTAGSPTAAEACSSDCTETRVTTERGGLCQSPSRTGLSQTLREILKDGFPVFRLNTVYI